MTNGVQSGEEGMWEGKGSEQRENGEVGFVYCLSAPGNETPLRPALHFMHSSYFMSLFFGIVLLG